MKMTVMLLSVLILATFSGCYEKQYIKPNNYRFLLLDEIKPQIMYFNTKEEKQKYENYIKRLREKISFYEWQIKLYNSFKE